MVDIPYRFSPRDRQIQAWQKEHLPLLIATARAQGILPQGMQLMFACAITRPSTAHYSGRHTADRTQRERAVRRLVQQTTAHIETQAKAAGLMKPEERITCSYMICPEPETISL